MKRTILRFSSCLLLIFLIFALSSCEPDKATSDSHDPIKSAAELTENDFEVSGTKATSSSEFQEFLNTTIYFENINKDAAAYAGSGSGAAISPGFYPPLSGSGYYRIISESINISRTDGIEGRDNRSGAFSASETSPYEQDEECLNGKITAVFRRNGKGVFRAVLGNTNAQECFYFGYPTSVVLSLIYDHVKVENARGEEADIEGEKLTDVFGSTGGYSPIQYNMRERLHMHGKYRIYDESVSNTAAAMVSLNDFSDFNAPCVISEDNRFSTCQIQMVYRFVFSHHTNYNLRIVLRVNEVVASPGDAYFTSGTIDFIINDWEGVMTYDDNGFTPPSYTATNTRTYEEVSGTYGGANF